MSDYDGLTNEFKQMPPELKSIIDKVSGYATQSIGGARGQTAAQGRALQSIMGLQGGLLEQGMKDQSAMARLGVEKSAATDLTKMKEAGDTERTKIGIEPSMMREKRASQIHPLTEQKPLGQGIGSGLSNFSAWDDSPLHKYMAGLT